MRADDEIRVGIRGGERIKKKKKKGSILRIEKARISGKICFAFFIIVKPKKSVMAGGGGKGGGMGNTKVKNSIRNVPSSGNSTMTLRVYLFYFISFRIFRKCHAKDFLLESFAFYLNNYYGNTFCCKSFGIRQ